MFDIEKNVEDRIKTNLKRVQPVVETMQTPGARNTKGT